VSRSTTSRRRSPRSGRGTARTPPAGARTPRGEATRATLVRAAKKVFERDGFLDARITDITATAGTATGSFYKYFSNKEEIFLAVVEALADEGLHALSLEILSTDHDDLVGDITKHLRRYLTTYQRNAKMMSVIEEVTNINEDFRRERTARAQPYMNGNVAAIGALQAAGRADPALDPLIAGRTLSTMISRAAYVTFVFEEEGPDSIDALARTLARLWINALRIPMANGDPSVTTL
jgi:AcrR family transcriptional regulator